MDIKQNRSAKDFVENEISTALFDLGAKLLSLRGILNGIEVKESIDNTCFKLPDFLRVELSKAVASSTTELSFEELYDDNKSFFEVLFSLQKLGVFDRS